MPWFVENDRAIENIMRIGVNCFLLQEHIGGLRQYFHRLFRELLARDHNNSYVFFYGEQNLKEMTLLGNDRWKDHSLLLSSEGEILLHLDKIDVYFCPFNGLIPRPVLVPSVVTLVDIQEVYYPQFFSEFVLQWRKDNYAPSTRLADQVITISEYSKESIALHHQIGKDKIHVAHLAADESFSSDTAPETAVDLDLPERYILYPANRWLHKNHENLLIALVVLRDVYALRIDCVLTGYDYADDGYPLRAKIREYDLENQIKILGYVADADMKRVYQKAEMLCFPSLFEGFGMPLVEAMVSGCPIVCSNATSIPEVVGDAALLFNPSDPEDIAEQIATIWNDRERRSTLIELGKERARQFSVSKMADVHLEAFEAAVRSCKHTRAFYSHYVLDPLYHHLRKPSVDADLKLCEKECSALREKVDAMQASLSWRLTALLRFASSIMRSRRHD